MVRALDILEIQVLVHFPGDDLEYHHRILLHRVAEGQWMTLTPDLELDRHDLAELDHVVLLPRAVRQPGVWVRADGDWSSWPAAA